MKVKNIVRIVITLLVIVILNNSIVQAASLGDVLSGGKNFISSGTSNTVLINETNLKDTSETIVNVLTMVAFVVVAIIGIVLGMKYMMSGVDEKADVKKSLIVFAIGAIVTFGAFGIWKVIVTFLNNSNI